MPHESWGFPVQLVVIGTIPGLVLSMVSGSFLIYVQGITWRGPSTDLWSSFCTILSTLALFPVNHNCLDFPRISAPSSQLKGLQGSCWVLFSYTLRPGNFLKTVRYMHIYNYYVFLINWLFYHYEMSIFLLGYILCLEVYLLKFILPHINIASPALQFTWYIFFYPFICNLSMLYIEIVSLVSTT